MSPQEDAYWIIVTDLDGTLLDHHTYSFSAAQETLAKLEQEHVPVIINSSKTADEIEQLRIPLKNPYPFIAENGSGILIPKNYFSAAPENANTWEDYWEVILGKDRTSIIESLKTLPEDDTKHFLGYHQMSLNTIAEVTGLTIDEAKLSNSRRYTEPLQWLGTDEEKNNFFEQLRKKHIHFTEGGRFIHLMGHCNKGSATSYLAKLYANELNKNVKVVALGDGKNDVDMLKASDIAVVIRSPVNPPPEFEHPCKVISENYGPEGWAETINQIFFPHS